MERLFEIGLSNAVMSLALAVLAALVGLLCRRPAVVHALWLLVLIKLVTPPLMTISIRPSALTVAEEPAMISADKPSPAAPEPDVPLAVAAPEVEDPPNMEDEAAPVELDEAAPDATAEAAPQEDRSDRSELVFRLLAGVWLIGSLVWFSLALRRAWRFSRALRQARAAPESLVERVFALGCRMGLRRCPRVLLVPGRIPPMVWAGGRLTLLVPEALLERVGEIGLDTLLLHELAHVRRRDHWIRWLEFAALGLFWWNPVAWHARRELREAEEQCCDAWVVRTLPGSGRAYATALIDALDFLCEARPALPLLGSGLGRVADLKRRLTMILRGATPHGLGWFYGLVVFGLALLLLPLVPLWGWAQAEPEEEQKKNILIELKKEADGDLKKMQAEIEQKAAELAALKAKMELIKRLTAAKVALAKETALKERLGVALGKSSAVIHIEISGLNMTADELKKLVETLEKTLPGKEKRVIVVASSRPLAGMGHSLGMKMQGQQGGQIFGRVANPGAGAGPVLKAQGFNFGTIPPGAGVPPGSPAADKRIDSVEKKLDLLLRELEALRKEIRSAPGKRGGAAGGAGGSAGGASQNQPGSGGLPSIAK